MTFTALQGKYIAVFRAARKVYRRADTAGEKLERELDRLIKRKRLIQPDDLVTAIKLYDAYDFAVQAIAKALADANQFIQWPVG